MPSEKWLEILKFLWWVAWHLFLTFPNLRIKTNCRIEFSSRSAGRRMKLGSPGVALECSQTKIEFFYNPMYLTLFISFRWINQTITMLMCTKTRDNSKPFSKTARGRPFSPCKLHPQLPCSWVKKSKCYTENFYHLFHCFITKMEALRCWTKLRCS